ncbi:MAG: molybdopterin-containing oxidoreductase family protein [Magnetospiraceae bacterium]
MASDYAPSVCPHDCPCTCPLDVEVLGPDRIGKVRGAPGNDYTKGVICTKVARYAERVHHPDRLTTPLRRVGPKGTAQFAPLSWDEALDTVADAFKAATAAYGAESVWPYRYAGTMGLVQRDGLDRLIHSMGYSRQHHTICSNVGKMACMAGLGAVRGTDPREMLEADLIVLWGINPVSTAIHVHNLALEARKTRGTKIICIDPYRTRTAMAADLHLPIQPGTDGAFACAVMHVLLRDGLADREFLADRTDFDASVETHLQGWTPERAAEITGLSAQQIEDFAKLYGTTQRSYIRASYGLTRSRNGAPEGHALSCLPAVSGAWRYPGGGFMLATGMCLPPNRKDMTGGVPLNMGLITGEDRLDPQTRIIDMSLIGAALTGDAKALSGGPPVKAMLVQNTNPAIVAPDSAKVREGLLREDLFLCVHEQFLTDTARYADIVLPATTFLEHTDLYRSYGHTYLQVARPVIAPFAEARSNHQVLCGLAERLGADHRGFTMTEWEIIDETLQSSGFPGADELAEQRWLDTAPSLEFSRFSEGFAHPDGRFRFKPDWANLGSDHADLPPYPDHVPLNDPARDEAPYRLVTAPSKDFLNSSFTEVEGSLKRAGAPTAFIHPEDCAGLGLAEGDRVRIGNDRGSVVVRAKNFEGLQRGVVIVESIWPEKAFEEGRGINTLVADTPAPPSGGASFHDTAVWLRKAG